MIAESQTPSLIDLDAEGNLLAGMIGRPSCVDEVALLVSAGDFADRDNRELFAALVLLAQAGKPINDATVLCRSLASAGCVWQSADVLALLREYFSTVPEYHAEHIRKLARLRRLQSALESAAARCEERTADPDAIARDLDGLLIGDECRQASEVESAPDVGRRVLESIGNRDRQRGMLMGVRPIDESIGVVCPGEMIVLAARPGVGKTALAAQFAHATALKGRGVLYVSLEMAADELVQRTLCSDASVDQGKLRTGDVTDDDRRVLAQAQSELPDLLRLWSPANATMAEIRGVARLEARRGDVRLIVIDYLQLVDGDRDNRRLTRYEQVTQISREVKQLAKALGVPVLALSQLSRAGNDRPQLIHLRESGGIEQDADIVLLLSRQGNQATLDVAKHRHSETGEIRLLWHPQETRFGDPEGF